MFYPQSWDNTPISLVTGGIGYSGVNNTTTNVINVRIVFKRTQRSDNEGNMLIGNGEFYKYGELDIKYGDNFKYDNTQYTVTGVYYARNEDGTIEYTKVSF